MIKRLLLVTFIMTLATLAGLFVYFSGISQPSVSVDIGVIGWLSGYLCAGVIVFVD